MNRYELEIKAKTRISVFAGLFCDNGIVNAAAFQDSLRWTCLAVGARTEIFADGAGNDAQRRVGTAGNTAYRFNDLLWPG